MKKMFTSGYKSQDAVDAQYESHKKCIKTFDASIKKVYKKEGKSLISTRILDIGAGTGMLGVLLKELGYINVDAIDGSEAMLQKAKEKNVYQKIMVKFVDEKKNEEIQDGEYDGMVSSAAITTPHIHPRAFDEMLRWLRKGK